MYELKLSLERIIYLFIKEDLLKRLKSNLKITFII